MSHVEIPIEVSLRWEPDDLNDWNRCPVSLCFRGEPVATMWLPIGLPEEKAVVELLKYVVGKT